MKILLFLLLLLGFFLLFHEMGTLEYLSASLKRTREGMDAASRQRSLADRQKLSELQEKHSLWYSLEQQLQYSGIRHRFPGMTAERWLTWNLAGGAILFLTVTAAGSAATAAATVLLCGLFERYGLKKLRERNLRRTEENLTKLLDFLGNYSTTSGEIVSVFKQIGRYMEEPVRSALDTCCYEAATTGDVGMALRFMSERIEHPKFKELVRNMEISIRYCADFSVLVDSSRRSLREYLRISGERKGMMREAAISLAILAGMSLVALLTVEKLTGIGIRHLMTETLPGRLGMAVLLVIFVWFRGSIGRAE